MPNFFIPLSGLSASSEALTTISNNLANLNTVGYKDNQATFRDVFYQTMGNNGANNPIQIGGGSAVGSVTSNFTTGTIQPTGISSNAAINGNGFFVVQDNGAMEYTRAGDFTVNSAGQLTTQGGQLVMGYSATNGVVSAGQTLSPLQVNLGQLIPASPTTSMQMQTNLDASAAVGTSFSTPLTVYDSLGTPHDLTFQYTKTGSNAWDYQITLPAADTGGTGSPTVITSGSMTFNPNGTLASPTGTISGISISGLADGAANLNLNWNVQDAAGNSLITQSAAPSATSTTFQDGFASGTLTDYSIGSDGVVEGTFSNGQTLALGQVVLANFANVQGLSREGQNTYHASLSSGAAVIGTPGTGGRGTLTGGAVEASNVDIATEFANMIVTQRMFQANASVVTTFDQVSQTTINMKQ